MCACSFYMCLIRELHIMFFEVDMPLLLYAGYHFMFIYPSENLTIFPLECEFELLSIEESLYLIGFLEFHASLIFRFFRFFLYLTESICGHFSSESFRDEHITRLSARYIDDIPLSSEVCDILQELYSESICSHRAMIAKRQKNAISSHKKQNFDFSKFSL